MPPSAPGVRDDIPRDVDLQHYVEERLFEGTIDSLAAHIDRKAAVGDSFRYSVLYLLYEYDVVPRKQLAEISGKTNNGLQHHLRDLIDANLIAEVPPPDDEDGRLTYYRITKLGEHEIEADIRNISGE